METWLMWSLVGLHVVGILTTVAIVGKPRQPLTGGVAATTVIINLMIISALIIWGNPS